MKIKNIILLLLVIGTLVAYGNERQAIVKSEPSLKKVLGENILIGVALNQRQIIGLDTCAIKLVKHHFNSIVAENCMKCDAIHPEENRFDFTDTDRFVAFGEENKMAIIGHCLLWHSQLAPWFCIDENGENVSPEVLKERIKTHIYTIVGRYKGRIKGWDVVNEAIENDGSWRKTPFYEILGADFIPLAFQYAHEADPDAELYYNDFSMDVKGKRDKVVELVKTLKEKGIRIDAVGMQGHMGLNYPKEDDFEQSIIGFSNAGVKVMITEWDMSALPTIHDGANVSDTVSYEKILNPYPEGLPDSLSQIWNARMRTFMDLFKKHAHVITRVTLWGVTDRDSWRNDFPVKGRTDYPLLFDRNYMPKPFVNELIKDIP